MWNDIIYYLSLNIEIERSQGVTQEDQERQAQVEGQLCTSRDCLDYCCSLCLWKV